MELDADLTDEPVVGLATGVTTATGTATGEAVCRSLLSAFAATAKRAMMREKDFIFVLCVGCDRDLVAK